MADGFFTQAVSHALDRYAQRTMSEEQLKQQREISDADLKEKYYYADIVRSNQEVDVKLRQQQVDELKKQRAFEEELVPIGKLPGGMPNAILRSYSPDGQNVRRADMPHVWSAYTQYLAATKESASEKWRMALMDKQLSSDAANRKNLYALLGAAREGVPGDIPTPEAQIAQRAGAEFIRNKAMVDATTLLPGGSTWGNIPGATNIGAAFWQAFTEKSPGRLLPTEQKVYTDALGGLQNQLKNVNATLDLLSDPRVNAELTPEMVGVLSRVKDRYDATMPTLSRFADAAMKNTLANYAKRIDSVIGMQRDPEVWGMELGLAKQRLISDTQLKVAEERNKKK